MMVKESKFCTNYVCIALSLLLLFAGANVVNASSLAVNAVESVAQQQGFQITGTVVDNNGDEMIGVAVQLRSNRNVGTITNLDGEFSINVGSMNESLLFSFLGMATYELRLRAGTLNYRVVMQPDHTMLDAVIIEGGIVQRDRASFTGAAHTISQQELRSLGNINLMQSLSTLDPAFVMVDNVLAGSDPNAIAAIELRGQTGLDIGGGGHPNMPLFIMDGFEVTAAEVNDMDINRIRSVTLLKDASSTAIFGARGSNGVVVIETIRPAPGRVQVIYSASMRLDWADLSQYNLMNAHEKLEFEVLTGVFGDLNNPNNISNINRYNDVRRRLAQGVDTDWMRMPVRLGVTQDHSLVISGGDNTWQFATGINYRNVQGVMRGSSRETFGGNIRVSYRGINNLNISNNLQVNHLSSRDGAWTTGVSFADFVSANPYYTPFDQYGRMTRFLGTSTTFMVDGRPETRTAANPLHNASLNSFNNPRTFTVVNNTSLDWVIAPRWRATGDMSVRRESTHGRRFIDPRHTRYAGYSHTLRGEYTERHRTITRFQAGANLTHTLTLQERHNFTFTGRTSMSQRVEESSSFIARGFPEGADPIPSFAYSFLENSRPNYSHDMSREVNFMLVGNYNFDLRYLFDFSFNNAGSTTFGSGNLFDQFWSIGLGWNVDREAFARDWDWLDNLRIRGTYGTTANQNTGFLNASVYGFWPGSDIFGTASRLTALGNPYLRWEVVTSRNIGFDAQLLNRRLNVSFDLHSSVTDPSTLALPRQASTGVSRFPLNIGELHRTGYEFRVTYNIIQDFANRILFSVRLTGAGSVTTQHGFEDALAQINDELWDGEDATINDQLRRFADGSRNDALWAIRSLGIDPATGREIFQRRDGTATFDFDPADRVAIAHANPTIQGVFGMNLMVRRLTAGVDLRYRLGGHAFNTALFQRVENISRGQLIYNQDRRALHDRWQNPGDIAQFRGISLTDVTQISSRFIQRNNQLTGESVRVSWDFSDDAWIGALGLQDFRATVSMRDIFYISTMRAERGINFPFARGVSFQISARF